MTPTTKAAIERARAKLSQVDREVMVFADYYEVAPKTHMRMLMDFQGYLRELLTALESAHARIADLAKLLEHTTTRNAEQTALLRAAYKSGHREGWENGPSTQETMDRIHDHLCNIGQDPNRIAEMEKRNPSPFRDED